MSLGTKLETTPHREVAGSGVFAAFEFQLMFGVELLFEMFDQSDDYAVLFEFHDDIVLLTGTSNPSEIEFFQLKHTTQGNWTMAKLSYQKKKTGSSDKEQSILQKLYGNVSAFDHFAKNAQIVSNSFCKEFGQSDNSKLNLLPDEKKSKILEHIRSAFPSAKSECMDVLGFRRTELDKSSCYELVKGRVHSFLQSKVGGDAFQLQACTDAIVTQCRLRNKKLATDVSKNTPEIVAQKGITKKDISRWLSDIAANKTAPDWSVVQPHIVNEWAFSELNDVRNEYDAFRVIALDSSNDAQNAVVRCIRSMLTGAEISTPLAAFVDKLVDKNTLDAVASENGYVASQLKAMVLYEIFKSQQTGTIQETDTQPTKTDQ